jgi:hypothetical protein
VVARLGRHLLEHLDRLGGAQEAPWGVCRHSSCTLHVSLLQELVELLLVEIVCSWEVESRSDLEGELVVSQLRHDVWHKRTLVKPHEEHLVLQRGHVD